MATKPLRSGEGHITALEALRFVLWTKRFATTLYSLAMRRLLDTRCPQRTSDFEMQRVGTWVRWQRRESKSLIGCGDVWLLITSGQSRV